MSGRRVYAGVTVILTIPKIILRNRGNYTRIIETSGRGAVQSTATASRIKAAQRLTTTTVAV
jgi:hypothetical protein